MRGIPQPGTPNFIPALVLPNIFNCSNFEYSALSNLKVDSRRRKRKKKLEKIQKRRKIVFRLGQTNVTKGKAVGSVLKNHKLYSIKIGIYRDVSVQTRPLSARFWLVPFWSRLGSPKLSLHEPFIITHIVCKFQLRTPSGF